jgi:hypothetical protein
VVFCGDLQLSHSHTKVWFLAGLHGTVFGLYHFSGWHHHTLIGRIAHFSNYTLGFRSSSSAASVFKRQMLGFRLSHLSLSRHHAFWSWAFSLLAQASSLRHSRIPRGMDVVTHFLLNVTDSNNLCGFLFTFFPFCHCKYYNTPPIYIDWRERAGWEIFGRRLPCHGLLSAESMGVYFSFVVATDTTHYTHIARYLLILLDGWREWRGRRGRRSVGILSYYPFIYYTRHVVTTHLHLHMFYLLSTYIPSSIRLLEELKQNHCHHCSAPMELSLYVPLSCATKILN